MSRSLRLLVIGLLAAVAASCAPNGPGSGTNVPVKVITTTTIFADMVRQVGGDRVSVETLVPRGGEVHTFDPTPGDIRRITEARLAFRNGLGLDDWLAALIEDAGTSAPLVELGPGLPGVTVIAGGQGSGEAVNPHLWMNIAYGSLYAQRIAAELVKVDPDGAAVYRGNLAAYEARLADLDAYAREQLGAIPEANRTVVSFHDAFPYFAQAYGLTIDGTIVDAPGQDPSAGSVAALVDTIRAKGVRAIFAEAQFNPDLAQTIAAETGARIVATLYTDSVGEAPQDTYESMMRWNIDQVVAALRG
ncbi:MAG TPA: metal ABC transporter substrate-binding protein [Candidatus Limnocylindrales bacterium]